MIEITNSQAGEYIDFLNKEMEHLKKEIIKLESSKKLSLDRSNEAYNKANKMKIIKINISYIILVEDLEGIWHIEIKKENGIIISKAIVHIDIKPGKHLNEAYEYGEEIIKKALEATDINTLEK